MYAIRSYYANLKHEGLGALKIIDEFNKRLESIIVSSSGPRYWGLVTGGTTPAAIVGDWLATIYDQNTFATSGHVITSYSIHYTKLYEPIL